MANYQDQARAIWDALDKMVAEDPDAYKRFVEEQMAEGRRMLKKKEGQGASKKPELEKAFGNMSLNGGGDGGDHGKVNSKEKMEGSSGGAVQSGPLLDDEIGKGSILAQIVKGRAEDEDSEDVKLSALEIGGDLVSAGGDGRKLPSAQTNKKKPLIEEI